MTTVRKDGVTKELDNDGLVADYVSAGWKLVETKNENTENKGFSK